MSKDLKSALSCELSGSLSFAMNTVLSLPRGGSRENTEWVFSLFQRFGLQGESDLLSKRSHGDAGIDLVMSTYFQSSVNSIEELLVVYRSKTLQEDRSSLSTRLQEMSKLIVESAVSRKSSVHQSALLHVLGVLKPNVSKECQDVLLTMFVSGSWNNGQSVSARVGNVSQPEDAAFLFASFVSHLPSPMEEWVHSLPAPSCELLMQLFCLCYAWFVMGRSSLSRLIALRLYNSSLEVHNRRL